MITRPVLTTAALASSQYLARAFQQAIASAQPADHPALAGDFQKLSAILGTSSPSGARLNALQDRMTDMLSAQDPTPLLEALLALSPEEMDSLRATIALEEGAAEVFEDEETPKQLILALMAEHDETPYLDTELDEYGQILSEWPHWDTSYEEHHGSSLGSPAAKSMPHAFRVLALTRALEVFSDVEDIGGPEHEHDIFEATFHLAAALAGCSAEEATVKQALELLEGWGAGGEDGENYSHYEIAKDLFEAIGRYAKKHCCFPPMVLARAKAVVDKEFRYCDEVIDDWSPGWNRQNRLLQFLEGSNPYEAL